MLPFYRRFCSLLLVASTSTLAVYPMLKGIHLYINPKGRSSKTFDNIPTIYYNNNIFSPFFFLPYSAVPKSMHATHNKERTRHAHYNGVVDMTTAVYISFSRNECRRIYITYVTSIVDMDKRDYDEDACVLCTARQMAFHILLLNAYKILITIEK